MKITTKNMIFCDFLNRDKNRVRNKLKIKRKKKAKK
jgi:hypothetical protein